MCISAGAHHAWDHTILMIAWILHEHLRDTFLTCSKLFLVLLICTLSVIVLSVISNFVFLCSVLDFSFNNEMFVDFKFMYV